METFTHHGITVRYEDVGDGPAIVFLHNGGTSSTIWRHQVDSLCGSHRVVAIDLPGFGSSPRAAAPVRLPQMVDVVRALIDDARLAPAVLVGNCMGSNIAVSLARRNPESVSAVLAINPLTEASFSGGSIGFLHRIDRIAPGPTRLLRSLSRRIRAPRQVGSASLRFQLGDKGTLAGLHHDPELLACQMRGDQMPAMVDVLEDMDSYGVLDADGAPIEVPLWILWGEQNRVLSRERARHLDQVLAPARVEVLRGCGHLPMLEDPDAVTELIESLVHRISTTTSSLTAGERS